MNYDLEIMWKEVVVTCEIWGVISVLDRKNSEKSRKQQQKLKSISGPRFETGTSKIRSKNTGCLVVKTHRTLFN